MRNATQPKTIDDLVDFTVTKVLDQFGIHLDPIARWECSQRE